MSDLEELEEEVAKLDKEIEEKDKELEDKTDGITDCCKSLSANLDDAFKILETVKDAINELDAELENIRLDLENLEDLT